MLRTLQATPAYFLRPIQILRDYRREDLRPDLLAGLTVSVVLLPQALAFTLIAGLPLEMGLYAAVVSAIVGALWGSSNHLNTGPTNTAAALVFSTLVTMAAVGSPEYIALAGLLAVLAGIFRLVLGLARLGMLVNFVSDAVSVGFTAGTGILIIVGQIATFLRLPSGQNNEFLSRLQNLVLHLSEAHLLSLLVGLVTLLMILGLQRLNPRLSATLVTLVVISAVVAVLDWPRQGVQTLGELPRGLPPLAQFPALDLTTIGDLSSGALAIAAIGLVEAASISRAIASHSRQRLDTNQEFVGQGLANIAAGLFSGYSVSGSFNRSALAFRSGGRTALTNVFAALFVLLAMNVFSPFAAYLPRPAIAAIQVLAAFGMINRAAIVRMWNGARSDALIMSVTLIATLLLPLQFAVLIGVLMSLVAYILQTSTPKVQSVLPDDAFRHWEHQPQKPACPQLAVVVVLGDLYFGATNHVEEAIQRNLTLNPGQRFLLLRMGNVQRCDISGILALENIVRTYRARGGDVYLVRVREPVRQLMRTTTFDAFLGADHFLDEDTAIDYLFYRVIDPAICIYECDVRAFRECQNLPKRPIGELITLQHAPPTGALSELTPDALWAQLRGPHPPRVYDVREPREFAEGHIAQARLLPLPELLKHSDELPRDQPIVLVCRGGRRSGRVAWELLSRGFSQVAVLRGGMLAWEAANLLMTTRADPKGNADGRANRP